MICSTLNSRLLLPPSTRPVVRSDGPMVRRSKPRTLYSPPRKSFSKIGSSRSVERFRMYSSWPRNAERHAVVLLEERHRLDRRLDELGVAAETGEVDRQPEALAGGRKNRLID